MVFVIKIFESRLRRAVTKKITIDKWNVHVITWDSVLYMTTLTE